MNAFCYTCIHHDLYDLYFMINRALLNISVFQNETL